MNRSERRFEECAVIPVGGQAIFTIMPASRLTLPFETQRRSDGWKFIVAGLLAISFWSFPTVTKAAVTVDDIVWATNAQRQSVGIAPLHHDDRLDSSAAMKANDMMTEQYFSHQSPSGQRGLDFLESAGYAYTEAGENLATNFTDSAEVVTAWMTSSTHRENILNAKYTDVGVAVLSGIFRGNNTTLVVQHFGSQTGSAFGAKTVTAAQATTQSLNPSPAPITPIVTPLVPAIRLVLSLTDPAGVSETKLVFTYLSPPTPEIVSGQPEVLGISTASNTPVDPSTLPDSIAWLILGALGLSASVIALASVLWPSIYPQTLKPVGLAAS